MPLDEQIIVGQIIKAQGLKGEVKAKPLTSDFSRFKKLKAVNIGTAAFRILGVRIENAFVFLRLAGIDSREAAESLKDKFLSVDRVHAQISDGEFFIADLIGCELFLDGERAGVVENILQHGAADVFLIRQKNKKTLMFPFLNSLNLEIDVEKRQIRGAKDKVDSVAVYED